MEIETTEKDGRLLIDMRQNHTLANLVRKATWDTEGEAAYDTGHPLGEESNLIIESDNPEEKAVEAVGVAREWLEELESEI